MPPPVYHPAGQALIDQARQQMAAGDLEAAGSTLERGLRVDPDNPWIWIELARVRSAAGDVRGARSMASRAAGLASQDPEAEAAARRLLGSGVP
ncbi:MAG: tetratricopeptide repeat protein [Gammaproteobacteria bacterium]